MAFLTYLGALRGEVQAYMPKFSQGRTYPLGTLAHRAKHRQVAQIHSHRCGILFGFSRQWYLTLYYRLLWDPL